MMFSITSKNVIIIINLSLKRTDYENELIVSFKFKVMKDVANKFRERLEHMASNLPSHLPGVEKKTKRYRCFGYFIRNMYHCADIHVHVFTRIYIQLFQLMLSDQSIKL